MQTKKLTLPGLPICLYVIHVNKRKMRCNRCISSLHHICRPCHKLFKSRLLIELTSGMSSGTFPIQDKERMGQSHFVLVFRSKCKCMAGPRIECLSWSLQQRLFFVEFFYVPSGMAVNKRNQSISQDIISKTMDGWPICLRSTHK